jgi:hypothetical protein
MVSHQPDFAPTLTSTPREFPSAVKNGALILMVVGAAAFAFGLFTQADRTLATFVINFMYWAGICQGALIFAAALVLVKGRWGRPLKRLAEAFSLVMVPLYLMLIVFMLAGGLDIYEWAHWTAGEAPPHKAIYLTKGFFIARQVVGLGVLIVLNMLFVRTSLRSDVGALTESGGYKLDGPLAMLAGIENWKGTKTETEASTTRQAKIAPAIVICYAIVFSVLAVDMSMSLAPHWYANMFPAWFFMSCLWSGCVWLGLYSLFARKWLGTEKIMDSSMYHDLGKLTFGLTMFWGYTTYAHYLPIWYGNMTEEIGFILIRTELEPWAGVTKVMLVVCFLVPWGMLLSRGLKKIPAAYMVVATVLAVGIWLERYVVIMPSVWKEDTVPLGLIEIGTTLGFLGMFLFIVTYTLSKVPAVCQTDPYMQPDPDHIHVLPKSQAHHH